MAFKSAIVKLTSFCNLNCSYCYMFNLGDMTYLGMPKYLDIETLQDFVDNIYAYLAQKQQLKFQLVLHGGEPFLWPLDSFKAIFEYVSARNSPAATIEFSIQTNAFQINWDLMDVLRHYKIPIGISIDGPKSLHDHYRVDHANKPTYDKIFRNVQAMFERGYGDIIGGFLTVANPRIAPQEYFDWLLTLPVKNADVLWPIEYNYLNTPWAAYDTAEADYKLAPKYGQWFAKLFDIWWEHDDADVYIRSFYDVITSFLGGKNHGDGIVNDQLNMFAVNTDGSIEYHDYFRAFKNESVKTGYHASKDSMLTIEQDALFQQFFRLGDFLPAACTGCHLSDVCGGGFLAGRMSDSIHDFAINKSILCHDQYYFFDNAKRKIVSQLNHQPQTESSPVASIASAHK